MNRKTKTVRVLDWNTRKVHTIPAAELAPNMVHAQVEGAGRVWVNASNSKVGVGKYQHQPFNAELREIIAEEIKKPLEQAPASKRFSANRPAEAEKASNMLARAFGLKVYRSGRRARPSFWLSRKEFLKYYAPSSPGANQSDRFGQGARPTA